MAIDPTVPVLEAALSAERAANERLREALTYIAAPDALLEMNGGAFGLAAARRMQAQARAALSPSTGLASPSTDDPEAADG